MDEIEKLPYQERTDEELKQLACAMCAKLVVTSENISTEDLPKVFYPLQVLSTQDKNRMIDDGIVLFYEYIWKQAPVQLDGLPVFKTFNTMNANERRIVAEYCDAIGGIRASD